MPESAAAELSRRLSQYPSGAMPFFRSAFTLASELTEAARQQILTEMVINFRRGRRQIAGNDLRGVTGLSASASEQIASVYSLLIGLLSETDATPDEFVDHASGVLFNPEDLETALSIARDVCSRRAEISETVERAQLAGAVLPILSSFSLEIDLRVKISDGKIRATVPVAVVHIQTDVDGEQFWLQLSQGDIEDLIKTLTKASSEMEIASTLSVPAE